MSQRSARPAAGPLLLRCGGEQSVATKHILPRNRLGRPAAQGDKNSGPTRDNAAVPGAHRLDQGEPNVDQVVHHRALYLKTPQDWVSTERSPALKNAQLA